MPIREEAEENLRVIRSLLERATIYRAVSAEAALVGGLLTVIGTVFLMFKAAPGLPAAEFSWLFTITWGAVLALASVSNLAFLKLAADLRHETLFSSGMKLALRAMVPGLLCGAFLTLISLGKSSIVLLPPVWMLCYAVALLATSHFAPRSIVALGWSFLIAGCATLSFWAFGHPEVNGPIGYQSIWLMGLTFGAFHIIYAVCAWPRRKREDDGTTP